MRCDHIKKLKEALDESCKYVMENQTYSIDSSELLNDMILAEEVEENAININKVAACVWSYYIPNTVSYRQDRLLLAAKELLKRFISITHSDGSQDLFYTNFHDPSQTGFQMYHLSCINMLAKYTKHTPIEDEVYDLLVEAITKCANALCTLGFHTPNHRWIQTNGLYLCKKYVDDPRIQETIDKYLWEGIDCDENGEYTEKSPGMYNYITNEAFIHMYANTGNKEYLEAPRRNLKLTRSFFEPDNTINTMNSLRQDLGVSNLEKYRYYWQYLYVGAVLQDPDLAYTADEMFDEKIKNQYNVYSQLMYALGDAAGDFEKLVNDCPSKLDKEDYSICLPNSGIARFYSDDKSRTVTVCKSRGWAATECFKIQVGNNTIYGRFAGDFFGKPHSQYNPDTFIQNEDGSVTLISHEEQGYRSQFDEKPDTSVWRHMDHSKRRWINMQKFSTAITFKVVDNKVLIDIDSSGVEGICCKFELSFNTSTFTRIITDGGEILTTPNGCFVPSKNFNYLYADSRLMFKFKCDKKNEHFHVQNERGSAPPLKDRYRVDFAQRNPYKQHIEIEIVKGVQINDIFKVD